MSHPDGATDPDDASMMVLDQIRRPFRRSRRSPVKCPSAKFDINFISRGSEYTECVHTDTSDNILQT